MPHIPGVDAAGTVDEIGDDVDGVTLGDHVFGIVELARLGGASAQFAVLQVWAHKPTTMPWTQAGAAGTSVETATRALDLLDLRPGMTLLVDGPPAVSAAPPSNSPPPEACTSSAPPAPTTTTSSANSGRHRSPSAPTSRTAWTPWACSRSTGPSTSPAPGP
ncbi:hypothetical protein NKG94_08585 [Micromonospora sp. M12]